MKNQAQLITYVDRLAGTTFQSLHTLLQGSFKGLFGGVHLLPFFTPIDGADAGFDPIDHTRVDARLGSWDDVQQLSQQFDVVADLIVNHISLHSPQCQDFLAHGADSRWNGLCLTRDRIFPHGPTSTELAAIYRPRPGAPFTDVMLANGETQTLWTTFTPEQIDIDLTHPLGRAYIDGILQQFAARGIRMVRLDAVGYCIKQAGTSCFMLPATFAYIDELSAQVKALGMQVLVEIHAHYRQQIEIARRVDWVYDFALPPLVLHALAFGTAAPLKHWLQIRPTNALTVLDTHDGIGIIDIGAEGDAAGLVPPAELDALVESIHRNSKGGSRLATGAAASNLDLYQVNCTYYDALGRNDIDYLLARALQLFVPGIPQIYYVGLLAGENDVDLLQRSGVGRNINRHYYDAAEVNAALQRPVVQQLCALLRLRNRHPAFNGSFTLSEAADTDEVLVLQWQHQQHRTQLHINFRTRAHSLGFSDGADWRECNLMELVYS